MKSCGLMDMFMGTSLATPQCHAPTLSQETRRNFLVEGVGLAAVNLDSHDMLQMMEAFVKRCWKDSSYPIQSMYGIFTYIYHTKQPNVVKYAIHRWYGIQ